LRPRDAVRGARWRFLAIGRFWFKSPSSHSLLGSLSALLVVAAFFAILRVGFVRHEERLLEATFGDPYREYRRSVRRWL
jgi:protein-S-isoprenylcysteine O-methyltransferase Ste14